MFYLKSAYEDETPNHAVVFDGWEAGAHGLRRTYSLFAVRGDGGESAGEINFHEGPKEWGPNGATEQAVLGILIDRLKCRQAGELRAPENDLALKRLEEVMQILDNRDKLAE